LKFVASVSTAIKNPKSIPVRNRNADPEEGQPLIDGQGRALRSVEQSEKNSGFEF
jgi:hypothetical protein